MRPRAAWRGTPVRTPLAWLKVPATAAHSEGSLAALLDEARPIVDAGLLPVGRGSRIARSRAAPDMGLEAPRKGDDGLEGDAGDRPIGRRGDLEPGQLRFVLHEQGFLDLAVRRRSGGGACDRRCATGES